MIDSLIDSEYNTQQMHERYSCMSLFYFNSINIISITAIYYESGIIELTLSV